MELIRGLHNLRPRHRGCVASIGNFDGLHLGHQAVLDELKAHARTLGLPTLVMLFEPQPREYFRPEAAPPRLMRLREKLVALHEQGIDRVLCVRFDARFAALTPEEFVQRVLVDGIGARHLVVGNDFRFGSGRRGDLQLLRQLGGRHGFEVAEAPTFLIDGERVSSTRVRAALAQGDLAAAARLLGRPYSICGRVVHGNKLGRQLGIPTANIRLHRRRVPLRGIFVAALAAADGECLPAAASIGTRPTVGGTEMLLEVHLLDAERDLYGTRVRVEFLQKLRDEQRFASLDAMRARMLQDIEAARLYFFNRRHGMPAPATRLSTQ
ncbi:MAG TPA: bifunctional riboflavin kinase/FAD synthetase [Vicinamibacterales bacterium]